MIPIAIAIGAVLVGGAAIAVTAGVLAAKAEGPERERDKSRIGLESTVPRDRVTVVVMPTASDTGYQWVPVVYAADGPKLPADKQPKLNQHGGVWTMSAMLGAIKALRKSYDAKVVIPQWGLGNWWILVNTAVADAEPKYEYVEVTLTKYLAVYLEDRGIMVWVMQNQGEPKRWSNRNDVE